MGGKWYFTAAELAALDLPGLPRAKNKVNELARVGRWALRLGAQGEPLSRKRIGRGGGLEYHVDVLPATAKLALAKRGLTPDQSVADDTPPEAESARRWEWFEGQSEAVKTEAHRRLLIVEKVELFERTNLKRSAAVPCAAAEAGVGVSTVWGYLNQVEGVDRADRLPFLAPRRSGGGHEAEVDEGAWQFLKSDYLRPERPTFTSCYHRCLNEYCKPRGIELPHQRTLRRKLEREVDGRLLIAKREGADAVRKMVPPQQRTVAHLHALELVNIDGHKFDVMVRFADGEVGRPIMVAIQDVYSRKLLAWRIGKTESAVLTRLAFARLFRDYGIPKGCVLDNGRAFASKWITGGAKSRFRFKIREEEPTGVLTALGVAIHWTIPYSGQSKPIERGFRDLCDTIARHPAMSGAYTGNHIDAKPENYGQAVVPIDVFEALVDRGIAAHNAKPGRRTEAARNASFDAAFAASYESAPIGRATPEQLRMALLTADEQPTDRHSGAVTLFGNRYWVPAMSQLAGKKVTVRFDPDDLTQPVHIYDRQGRYLVSADVLEQTGFLDAGAAKERAKAHADLKKSIKRSEELEQLIAAKDLAAMMPDHIDEAPVPTPTVIRPVRHRHNGIGAAAVQAGEAEATPFIDRFETAVRRLRVVE